MTEYKKEVSVAATIAIAVALGVGILAISVFPNGFSTTTTTTTTHNNIILPITTALAGELSAQDVSCSLTTGVCTLTIVNNSTDPLELETCQMGVIESSTVNPNATITEYGTVNGTIGGPVTTGIPANSQVTATCTVPTTRLVHQTEGSMASGNFMVKLVDSWYSYPAGTETGFSFQGTWS